MITDRCGRRPVVLFSLASTGVLAVAFGFSTTFLWSLACRFLLGLLNRMAVIFPTLVSEICGKEHEVVGLGAMTSEPVACRRGFGIGPPIFFVDVLKTRSYRNLSATGAHVTLRFLFFNAISTSLAVPPLGKDKESGSCSAAGEERSKSCSGSTSSTNGTEVSRGRHSLLEEGQGECATSCSTWTDVEPFNRGSLLGAGHVRVLLIIYGTYMVGDLFALWALSTTPAGGLEGSAEQIGQVALPAMYCTGSRGEHGPTGITKGSTQMVLLAPRLMVFVFELFAVPLGTKRLGVTTSQRLSSVTLVLVSPLVPVPGFLLNTGPLLMIASVGLLLKINAPVMRGVVKVTIL
ncbi:unnamed protein product [Ectocarpus sp. CCAP 1310/34]|nr:unnamed protein product [Ectocarpus sp. CCAP 1310/34]